LKTITLYQRTKTGKTQEWSIWVVEQGESGYPEVHIRHGLTDGKKQTTYDVIKSGVNVGKANETTALQQAYLEMERKATKQREEGYKDSQEQAADDSLRTIDWSKPLPKELCFFKPKNSIDDSKLKKLDTAGHAVYSVKRDGLCHIAYVSDFGADMVSRRMDVVSDRFPHLTSTVKSLPAQTILLGEVIYEKDGRDDFNTCCSICRSDADEAQRKQDKLGKVKYYVFDVAFYKGECLLTTKTFAQRRELLL
jgi:ATP-dependent DNA ligase